MNPIKIDMFFPDRKKIECVFYETKFHYEKCVTHIYMTTYSLDIRCIQYDFRSFCFVL